MPTIEAPQNLVLVETGKSIVLDPIFEFGMALDRSSSMTDVRMEVIRGYNALVDDQRKTAGRVRSTLVEFGSLAQIIYTDIPIESMPRLALESYAPAGSTALLDGIGLTIETIAERVDYREVASKVLVAILSDGAENSSLKYSLNEIAGEIDYRIWEDGWEFIYLAADDEAAAYAAGLGIPDDHIFNFLAEDIEPLLLKCSKAVTQYRLGNRDYLQLLQ
jgi:hypothetical protein